MWLLFLWLSIMAQINFATAEQLTNQTTTSTTYVDVTGASIASGSFTAGKKYLLFVTAQIGNSTTANGNVKARIIHGSTAFAESEEIWESRAVGDRGAYHFMTVWTAVSAEGVKLQFASPSGTDTVNADQAFLLAINLSDDLIENTDWIFAERLTDDTLSTTFLDGASITFTPGTAGHDWLVLSYNQNDPDVNNTSFISRLDRSGEAASALPECRDEAPSATYLQQILLARVFNLGAASNTFKERAATTSGTSHNRLHSSVFALNLNKFKNHANAYTEADLSLSATDYATELQTISLTPDQAGDVWIGAFWGFDKNATNREAEFRVQVDNADEPAGQTTNNYQFNMGNDATDETPQVLHTVENLTAAAHTIDLDASADSTTSTPAGQRRTLWAMTMELAAAGGQTIAVGQVVETDLSQAVLWAPKRRLVVQAVETDLAQAISWAPKHRLVNQVSEVSLAQSLTARKAKEVAQTLEADLAQAVTWAPKRRLVGLVLESDFSQGIQPRKIKAVIQVFESQIAQAIAALKMKILGQATETDIAESVAHVKTKTIGQISEINLAQDIQARKIRLINGVTEIDLSQAISTSGFLIAIAQVLESDLAQAIAWAPKHRLVGLALESDLAQTITARKIKTIGQVLETEIAQALIALKIKALGQVSEADVAQAIATAKRRLIEQILETDLSQTVAWAPKRRLVGQVSEIDLAQIITPIILSTVYFPAHVLNEERTTFGILPERTAAKFTDEGV